MFTCDPLKVVTVEVFSTHPIWSFSSSSTPASPYLRLSFQLDFNRNQPMFTCDPLKVVTVEVFSTHPIWSFSSSSTPASPRLRLSFHWIFNPKSTHVYMRPFKGGDGWGFFNSSNLKFQLIFNSGQPTFKVKFQLNFQPQIRPCLHVTF